LFLVAITKGEESTMPYDRNADLPKGVRDNLPRHAQTIYRAAFNDAFDQYKLPRKRRDDASREESAHKVAWNAVKQKYHKEGDRWVKD
jgi:cation transport regulator